MILLVDIFEMECLGITSFEIFRNRNLLPPLLARKPDILGCPSMSNPNDGLDLYFWLAISPHDMTGANPKTLQETSQPPKDM